MRIAIAYNFNDRDWLGGKNYFASLFGAVARVKPPEFELFFFTGNKTQTTLPVEFPWLKVVRTAHMDRMHPLWLARQFTLRAWDRDPLLARLLEKHRIDVLTHSGHLGPKQSIKTMPWLYDFQFMHLPQYWERKHIRWATQRYNAACRWGDAIIVSSHDSKRDLAQFAPWCRVPQHVLQFVSNPVDFERLPTKQVVLEKYSLPADYFYLPNQFWANKNHRLAIDALALLHQQGIQATIACTGKTFDGRMPGYFDELMGYCKSVGMGEAFKVLGVVPYSDLQGLMAHATAVINPSRFEGWSTTVEEAKTFQQRLLLSDLPVHREQAPELGRFFGSNDAGALANHMKDCLTEPREPVLQEAIQIDYESRLIGFGHAYVNMVNSVAPKNAGNASVAAN